MPEIKIIDHTAEVRAAMDKAIDKALEMCGLKAEGYAKKNLTVPIAHRAPRINNKGQRQESPYPITDTGRLEGSITHTAGPDQSEYIGTNVEYAAYVEMGTSRSQPYPYLKPAVADHTDVYARIIKQCLNEI